MRVNNLTKLSHTQSERERGDGGNETGDSRTPCQRIKRPPREAL